VCDRRETRVGHVGVGEGVGVLDVLEQRVETFVSLSAALVSLGKLGVGPGLHEIVDLVFGVRRAKRHGLEGH
jgi:hypothetical protein